MPYLSYKEKRFSDSSLQVIAQAESICQEYAAQGFDLTLRQLYYQFVARGLIDNKQTEYKRLGSIINDARMTGKLDWDYIVDRTRHLRDLAHWNTPADIIEASAQSYRFDLWKNQAHRPEVWIEKDALTGVIEGVAQENDIPFFSCRGYPSQSEIWRAGQRMVRYLLKGQKPVVIHLGDHDPSGIDMTRDIFDRLHTFIMTDSRMWEMAADHGWKDLYNYTEDLYGGEFPYAFEVRRIALNMDQVDQYDPPPNPTKLTDSRSEGYINTYGYESWELDALDPPVMRQLIQDEVETLRDDEIWAVDLELLAEQRRTLQVASSQWDRIVSELEGE